MINEESTIIATPVIKNKFWIVEQQGKKIATIQAIDDGGFVWVTGDLREKFTTIKSIKEKYRINVFPSAKTKKRLSGVNEIYGYPTLHRPYGEIFDVKKKLPIYSRSLKSKSFYCAGYYLIKVGNNWIKEFCPKLLTLKRHQYLGPYVTEEQCDHASKKL